MMDHSNRRKINRPTSRRNNARKETHEVNGNNQTATSYKVENTRRQKYKPIRNCYENEEQDHNRMRDALPNYIPMHGQRLFAAVSDPAVCGCPVPLSYPYDHIPLSLGYPVYSNPYPHRVPYKDSVQSSRKPRPRNNHDRIDFKDSFQTVDEYTSLPPGNLQDIESDHQRRFSDPGLANNTASEEDSLSNGESSISWIEDSQVASQIESLVQENKRLSKELKETQVELRELKLEVASLTQAQSSCEPGFISELVKEVREAAKLTEETMLARLKSFSENFQQTLSQSSSSEQLKASNSEKDELATRLVRLEEQMNTILTHNSIQETSKGELFQSQMKNQQLKEDLKSAVDAKTVAEANSSKYELLLNSLTKKLPNGLVLEEKMSTPAVSLDTSESLSSSLGSGSLHSPQVTMSGPVTDL